MQKKNHIYFFDYLRLFAAVSVIYMHVASTPLNAQINTDWHLINVLTSLGFTAVPLFFMMSGSLLLSSEKTLDIDVLIKKRLPRLIVPLAFWSLVAIAWKMYVIKDFSIGYALNQIIASFGNPAWVHLWYMYTLVAFYILSPILCGGFKALDRKGHILILTLILIVNLKTVFNVVLPSEWSKYYQFDIIEKMTFFQGHLNTFILGYYLTKIKKQIPNFVLVSASVLVTVVIIVGTARLSVENGTYVANFQNQSRGFEVILAALIFLLFKQNLNRESKFLKAVPIIPLALPIYLMHNILLSMTNTIYYAKSFVDTIIITFLNLVICFLCMKTVVTIKPICYLVTGMSYKEASDSCNWIYTYRKLRKIKNN